ncbi:hypothetical protein AVCANL277_03200 [Campylobacter canadensis]|uniref:hypothetical protein n=1 Tax=Campylobacter canadensis TaxID=449520 RepID=UPI001CCE1288|nr:hypothetical protein [Campylobacter canadensis]MBZ7999872.1 hypothetical protein [Campylobacter canadensis]MBZ8001800.1 hypothetical protein [Campylobacter canadensis]
MKEVASFWYSKNLKSSLGGGILDKLAFKKNVNNCGLSSLEILCIKSFIDNNFTFTLYTYDKNNELFNRLQKELKNFYVKDANEIVDFSEYFDDNRGAGVAAFSDYFRFRMINKSNVAWVDTDMLCLKEFDLSDYVVITQAGSDGHLSPTTSMLKYPQNSELANYLIDESKKIIAGKKMVEWGVIGPVFLARAIKELKLEHILKEQEYACAINWADYQYFTSASYIDFPQNSVCAHLWTEMWKGFRDLPAINKDIKAPFNSIYERYKRKHNIYEFLEKLSYKL